MGRVGDWVNVSDEQSLYDELYRAQHARITRLCRLLLSDPHEAEEAAQEVFVKLIRAGKAHAPNMAWTAWLTRVAVNTCRDRRRSRWWRWWREETMDFAEVQLPTREPNPEERTVGREERERIWRFFRKLSARQQEVFILRYVEEWSGEDVAALLGITEGAVKQHLFRAVRHLRQALGGSS
jgi:RNA polymerase sigma-70 factor (ECF subfamily)